MNCDKCGHINDEQKVHCSMCGNELKSFQKKRHEISVNPPREYNHTLMRILIFISIPMIFIAMNLVNHADEVDITSIIVLAATIIATLVIINSYLKTQRNIHQEDLNEMSQGFDANDTLKDFMHRKAIRLDNNWRERNSSGIRKFTLSLTRRDRIIGFHTEDEIVTITMTKDGGIAVGEDVASRHHLDLFGSKTDMLRMLNNASDLRAIPSSIRIMLREKPLKPQAEMIANDAAASILRSLFKQD